MEKKISVKTMFLLLVISVGLIGLGIGSTYAVFTASAEIDNPIVFNTNLSYEGGVMDTVTVNIPKGGISTVTLNINNTSGSTLNYIVWYLKSNNSIRTGTSSGNPQSSLSNGGSTTVVIDIRNMEKEDIQVIVGVSSGTEIVLSKAMTPVSSSSFTKSSQISYDNSITGVNCSDVTCMLDELYDIATIKPGDYVYYKPTVKSYPVDTSKTGYTGTEDQTIYPEELELWRVLNINSDGTIDLISEYVSSTNVYFRGQKGYLNFVGYLNVLAEQYETEGITSGSRCFGYNGQIEYLTDTEPSTIFVNPPPFGCSTDGKTGNCSNTDYPNDPDDYEDKGGGDTLYTTDYDRVYTVLGTRVANKVGTTTAGYYWMASRYYYYGSSSNYTLDGRYVGASGNGGITSLYYYNSGNFGDSSSNNALRPIVTLKSGLEFKGAGTEDNPRRIITS